MKGRKFVNEGRRHGANDGYLYGQHVIESWLQAAPARLRRLWVRARPHGALAGIVEMARAQRIGVDEVSEDQLSQLVGPVRHQGVVGLAREFLYVQIENLLAERPETLVMLDQIQDPRNLGAILRTAAAVAVGGIILPKDGTVGITPTVEAAAAGTAARLPVARVTNLVRTIGKLQQEGYWTVALDAGADVSIFEFEPTGPSVLVVGGEAGVRPLLLRTCDQIVSIPMPGPVDSLNVSVAAAVGLYEMYRRSRGSRRLP